MSMEYTRKTKGKPESLPFGGSAFATPCVRTDSINSACQIVKQIWSYTRL